MVAGGGGKDLRRRRSRRPTPSPATQPCRLRTAISPDAAGNAGVGGSDSGRHRYRNPALTVNIVDPSLSDTDGTSSVVSFTFSEAARRGFGEADIHVSSGLYVDRGFALHVVAGSGGKVYEATVTATDAFTGNTTVSVANGDFTDAVGNAGVGGSDSVAIDTENPTLTVNIVDPSLSDTDNSSVVASHLARRPAPASARRTIHVSSGLSLTAGSLHVVAGSGGKVPTGATVTATERLHRECDRVGCGKPG